MTTTGRFVGGVVLLFLSFTMLDPADFSLAETAISVHTEFVYQAGENEPLEKSRALAFFGARRGAVASAAKIFMQQGLLKQYQEQAEEIYCLAADKIDVRVVQERYAETSKRYFVEIEAAVGLAHFMEADSENQALEEEEGALPWREEMEQNVSRAIHPGKELSRAYRYLRKGETRIAIIYLDHLAKKYSNWSEVYYLRAQGFQRMHADDRRMEDLDKACALGHAAACRERQALK